MIVTDKKFFMEKWLVEKLDLICERCNGKHDALMVCDGDEGFGKTTLSGCIAYYIAHKLKRPFSVANFFFNLDEMIKFAISHEKQVIVWDESALGGLASEWNTPSQKKLMKMLMVARKKRHFYIFNIPRFFKLNEYIIVDRSIGLVHVYSRDGKTMGRFTYYKNHALERLFLDWKRSKKRNYKMHYSKRGSFVDALKKIIDMDVYEKMKDEAMLEISKEKGNSKKERKLTLRHYQIATYPLGTQQQKAEHFGVDQSMISKWKDTTIIDPNSLGNLGL